MFSLIIFSCNNSTESTESTDSENNSGCLDDQACNYDPEANIDNNSCLYFDCEGNCVSSTVIDACEDPIADDYYSIDLGIGESCDALAYGRCVGEDEVPTGETEENCSGTWMLYYNCPLLMTLNLDGTGLFNSCSVSEVENGNWTLVSGTSYILNVVGETFNVELNDTGLYLTWTNDAICTGINFIINTHELRCSTGDEYDSTCNPDWGKEEGDECYGDGSYCGSGYCGECITVDCFESQCQDGVSSWDTLIKKISVK